MAGVAMDTATVAQAAIDTTNAKLDVDGELQALKALCDDLAAGWSGQGAVAFANVMEAWDAEAAKLLDALDDIANSLDSSAAQQADQDAQSQSDFSSFDAEL